MVESSTRLDGKYRVLRRLGSGGFGEVFLAEDAAIPDRQVAIKVLNRREDADQRTLLWEMQTLAKFNHPHVVAFYHHFTAENRLHLVMEFCPRGSLDDRLVAERRPTESQVFKWGLELCETLAFVHAKGIVHHDIKPMNILFAADETIKLGDFGVANLNTGTRLYMAPEQLLGERVLRTDPRVDIYALGLTLLELLMGRHPFEEMPHDEAVQSRVAHDFVPRDLPRWVQEVLLRGTHPTPELRFQTMEDFAHAIRAKSVPYVFDGKRMKAHVLAEKAERAMARKNWRAVEKNVAAALHLAPDCVAALLAAGRAQLLIRRLAKAKEYFTLASTLSPRTHVQKELGWLNLEEGNVPTAISLLTEHLQRNAADYEAYNLLLKCFFLSGRYEAGEQLADTLIGEKSSSQCLPNNRFLCQMLRGGISSEKLKHTMNFARLVDEVDPLLAYNAMVSGETPSSWGDGGPSLKSKLIFAEYRIGLACRALKRNDLALHMPDGSRRNFRKPIITFGALNANHITFPDRTVSRRHAVIVNFPNEVWLYDLGSATGTFMDGKKVEGRAFLDGVHEIKIGSVVLQVAARADSLA